MTQLPGNLLTERAGVLAVAAELNRLGLIWRETPMADVGIDGQIEFVDDSGETIGRVVAAQIKSGESWFRDGGDAWRFYPEERHRRYWERFPLPVLLFLHSPAEGTFWTDVRLALRSPERSAQRYIAVPKTNHLQSVSRDTFFSSVGASGRPFLPLDELLTALASLRSPSASLPLSYLDLFANGLTNIGRSVYYGMDLVMEVAETLQDDEMPIGLGGAEDEFLFGFVLFLVEQQIADVDISSCLIQWNDAGMHPAFIAPLTSRGRMLVRLIHSWEARLTREGKLQMPEWISLAQETFIRMQFQAADYVRMPLIQQFGRLIAAVAEPSGR
ncbi:MAG TPA: DUF4365 domain-containing protein [Longimicrobium sp.]|jgi:hypothetical protein|uniref:DUF4365 domain-containing protein n=1 Tax=Longimicrobium sp. TaxID=2029185 RepID=UPI002EDAE2A0